MRERETGTNDSSELTPREAAFAARLGAALRADAAAPEDFDERVMRTIRTGGDVSTRPPLTAEQGRPWWTRKHAFALSPVGTFALAAGFAGIVALGTLAAVQSGIVGAPATVAEARVDTVHVVRFVFQREGAHQVALVGDFNGWSRDVMPLEVSADGATWTRSVTLAPGRYEYAFVVDGQVWVADPSSRAVRDEFGGETSILRLASNGDRVM